MRAWVCVREREREKERKKIKRKGPGFLCRLLIFAPCYLSPPEKRYKRIWNWSFEWRGIEWKFFSSRYHFLSFQEFNFKLLWFLLFKCFQKLLALLMSLLCFCRIILVRAIDKLGIKQSNNTLLNCKIERF